MGTSEAQKRATKKYEAEKIERVTLRLKKGTTDRIKAVSNKSINSFITEAIENQIERETD